MFHLDLSLLSLGSSSDNNINKTSNNKTTNNAHISKNKSILLSDPIPMTLSSSSDACSSSTAMNKTIPTTTTYTSASTSSIRSTISYSLPSPPSSPYSSSSLKKPSSPPSSPKAILENVIANRRRRRRSRSRTGSGDSNENISVSSSSSISTINSKKSLLTLPPPSSPSRYSSLKPPSSPPSSPKVILENVTANRRRRSRSRSGRGDSSSENRSVSSSSSISTINSKKSLTLSFGRSIGSSGVLKKLIPRKKKKNIYDQKPTTITKTNEQQQLLPPMHDNRVRQVEVLLEEVDINNSNDDYDSYCGIEITTTTTTSIHQGGKINDEVAAAVAVVCATPPPPITARIQVGEYNNIPDLLRYIDSSDSSPPSSSDDDIDYYEIHGDGDNGDGCLFGLDIEDDMDIDMGAITNTSFVEPYQPDKIEQPKNADCDQPPAFAFDDLIMFVNNERKILEYTSDEI